MYKLVLTPQYKVISATSQKTMYDSIGWQIQFKGLTNNEYLHYLGCLDIKPRPTVPVDMALPSSPSPSEAAWYGPSQPHEGRVPLLPSTLRLLVAPGLDECRATIMFFSCKCRCCIKIE